MSWNIQFEVTFCLKNVTFEKKKVLQRGVCFTTLEPSIKILAWKKLNLLHFTQIIIIKSLTLFCGLELTRFWFWRTHSTSFSHTHPCTHTRTFCHPYTHKCKESHSTQKDHKFKANHYLLSEMCGNCWYENSWRKCKSLLNFAPLSLYSFLHFSFPFCLFSLIEFLLTNRVFGPYSTVSTSFFLSLSHSDERKEDGEKTLQDAVSTDCSFLKTWHKGWMLKQVWGCYSKKASPVQYVTNFSKKYSFSLETL